MSAVVSLLQTAREPRTADELWHEIVTMRANKCDSEDLPKSKIELDRMLRMQRFAGRLTETGGMWSVVVKPAEKRQEQGALFS